MTIWAPPDWDEAAIADTIKAIFVSNPAAESLTIKQVKELSRHMAQHLWMEYEHSLRMQAKEEQNATRTPAEPEAAPQDPLEELASQILRGPDEAAFRDGRFRTNHDHHGPYPWWRRRPRT